MQAEMSTVGRFFQQVAPPVLHYKVCSTFDSAPHVGNIAYGIQTLHPFVKNRWVPIVGGQPSLGRYCAFSHLFADAGTAGHHLRRAAIRPQQWHRRKYQLRVTRRPRQRRAGRPCGASPDRPRHPAAAGGHRRG